MMQIITIGKQAPKWSQEACASYTKRLRGAWSVTWVELPVSQEASSAVRMRQEGERILGYLKPRQWVVVLDRKGQNMNSEAWANAVQSLHEQSRDIVWVIGGSDGLSESVLARANQCLSLAELTFPHALVRVMLVEQIYRSWSILHGHPYHK